MIPALLPWARPAAGQHETGPPAATAPDALLERTPAASPSADADAALADVPAIEAVLATEAALADVTAIDAVLATGAAEQPQGGAAQPARPHPSTTFRSTVVRRRQAGNGDGTRAGTMVGPEELEQYMPRSAPEALRWEPGVYVQQTASSQGSPYLRGLTGQQTLLLFDGVRINNSLFRQGPNQYLFTMDPRVIEAIEVIRGSSSVLWGSDALGGVIHVHPIDAETAGKAGELSLYPRLQLRTHSADDEQGGRLQLKAGWGEHLGFFGGFGARRAGLLESGGPIHDEQGQPALVPRYAADGRTQLGTGFDELTGDGRLLLDLGDGQQLRAATYIYRQYDAPRTDRCPSAFAPTGECMSYDEQFRTLAYLSWDGRAPRDSLLHSWRLLASFQRQHERRTLVRPQSFVENGGRDDVNTVGLSARGRTRFFSLARQLDLGLQLGVDATQDDVHSRAWSGFTDLGLVRYMPRGQYIEGSTYGGGGIFGQAELLLGEALGLRAGGRLAHARARADADPESGTVAVDQSWTAVVGGAGLRLTPRRGLNLLLNADQGFRAPNLDDLTSRQQVGPGYQMENAGLQPERSLTLESGIQLEYPFIFAEFWAYRTTVDQAIARRTIPATECPAGREGEGCRSSWHRYRLVNVAGDSLIYGGE
ncbi:MAG: TonB-dependent receptor, partial [Deltaproteobacteria bacterium]|nr:TonB-dependent receptor [Deltaproteobacteria bacterium]